MSSPDFSCFLRDSDEWCADVSSVGFLAFRKAVVDESLDVRRLFTDAVWGLVFVDFCGKYRVLYILFKNNMS